MIHFPQKRMIGSYGKKMEKMIEIRGLSKTYGKHRVLNDIGVDFEKGKIHGIIGRNGSGKTVLMKCICGFTKPDSGSILVGGEKVSGSQMPSGIGIIIESPGFIDNMSGFKNLQMLASIRKQISKDKIRETMRRLELDPDEKKPVRTYSLGMRQRLGIAQAIMEDPELLILDEPMNSLDKKGVEMVRNILKQMRENGTTILLASHYAEDIDALCDTVSEMDQGVLTEKQEEGKQKERTDKE